MPRHLQMYGDRYLCERVVPGNRVTVIGIYCIKKGGQTSQVRHICIANCAGAWGACNFTWPDIHSYIIYKESM